MVYYEDAGLYIRSQTDIKAKIVAIDNIINALLDCALLAATKAHITEYSLNSGQTQIKTSLRGVEAVQAAIQAFRTLQNNYITQLRGNGRVSRMIDGKNLVGRRYY